MFLHAHQVSFVWPDSGTEFSVSAPLPAELDAVIDALGREETPALGNCEARRRAARRPAR